jgi:hypothetical protein
MILPANETAVAAYCNLHGITTVEAKAEALLRAGMHWKNQVGPAVDKSGYTLATPVRQFRVSSEEGYMEIVDSDE